MNYKVLALLVFSKSDNQPVFDFDHLELFFSLWKEWK